jgi:hypothetical protein
MKILMLKFPFIFQTPKKSQFSLKRKKSSNKSGADELNEFTNFVCPMGSSGDHLLQINKNENCATTNNNISVSF